MVDAFLSAAAVAILTGVTVLAYKSPPAYDRLVSTVSRVLGVVVLFVLRAQFGAITVGVTSLHSDVVRQRDPIPAGVVADVSDLSSDVRTLKWGMAVTAALLLYVVFLYMLPELLKPRDSPPLAKDDKPL